MTCCWAQSDQGYFILPYLGIFSVVVLDLPMEESVMFFLLGLCLIYTVRRQVGCSWVWGRPQGWPQLFVVDVQALQEPCISFAIIPEKMNKSSTFHGETHCQRPFPRCSKHSLLIIFIYLCSVYTKIFLSSENLGLCWYHSKTEECKFFLY